MILKQVLKGLRDSRDTFLYTHHPTGTRKAADISTPTLLLLWSILLLSLRKLLAQGWCSKALQPFFHIASERENC